ncbi:hypothetical protein PUN28_018540 [Cardiocondyla obscurior]|uniref:Uncharacterized protein n=1 Tax=Cardiocondyla obscurior TaxID=286306 RepID=A0AAW2EFA2_9HYME
MASRLIVTFPWNASHSLKINQIIVDNSVARYDRGRSLSGCIPVLVA